jgi:hypothetical protein
VHVDYVAHNLFCFYWHGCASLNDEG